MFNNIFYCFYIEIYNEKYYFYFFFVLILLIQYFVGSPLGKNPQIQIHKHNFGSLWLQIMLGWEVKEGREK